MTTLDKLHRALGSGAGVQRDPHSKNVGRVDRPVEVVLVPRGLGSRRIFDQGLIVVESDMLNSHELCCDMCELLAEDEVVGVGFDTPEVGDLCEDFTIVIYPVLPVPIVLYFLDGLTEDLPEGLQLLL